MSAKTSPARRAAFLKALAETGNHTIAAAHAKVSRSWVTLHKQSDPAFRAACDAALAGARGRLRSAAGTSPSAASATWGHLAGEELVIRGTNGVRAQISRARIRQWTARTEAIFLRTLAATANVKAACAAAGLSVASAYVHRSKYNAFAERWAEVIAIGAERLEWQLMETAINSLEGARIDPDAPIPGITAEQAIRMLQMHRKAQDGWNGNRSHKWRRRRSLDEVRASILKKLEAIERQQAREMLKAAEANTATRSG